MNHYVHTHTQTLGAAKEIQIQSNINSSRPWNGYSGGGGTMFAISQSPLRNYDPIAKCVCATIFWEPSHKNEDATKYHHHSSVVYHSMQTTLLHWATATTWRRKKTPNHEESNANPYFMPIPHIHEINTHFHVAKRNHSSGRAHFRAWKMQRIKQKKWKQYKNP